MISSLRARIKSFFLFNKIGIFNKRIEIISTLIPFIKNISSSISHKKPHSVRLSALTSLRYFSYNLWRRNFFNSMMYDLRGHLFIYKGSFFLDMRVLKSNLIKTWYECEYYEDTNSSWNEVWPQRSLNVMKDHYYAKILWSNLIESCMNAYNMKMQIFHKLKYDNVFVTFRLWPNYNLDFRSYDISCPFFVISKCQTFQQ